MQTNADKNKWCILIPTFNRSGAMEYYLEEKLDIYRNRKFDVIIYDSSKDDLTKNIVMKYIEKGYDCLEYVHYEDPADDIYGTRKVRDALAACAGRYEYVWLCGDTTMLRVDEYEDDLTELLESGYDVIHIYENSMGINSERDMDFRVFLEQFYWSMTHWCSFLLSKRLIQAMEKWMDEYLARNYVTVVVFSIFAALAKGDFKIAYINHEAYQYSPYRTSAISYTKKDILRGYAQVANEGIANLPNEYDAVKREAKKGLYRNTGLFSKQSAIDLRADGNLTLKKLTKYRSHLAQVTDVPMAWFYLWSLTPAWIARRNSSSYSVNVVGTQRLQELNEKGGRLLLYGAGEHGVKIQKKIEYYYKGIQIAAISDKNWKKMKSAYQVISPEEIPKQQYDYVGITIVNNKIYKQVRKMLIKLGVPARRIIHI